MSGGNPVTIADVFDRKKENTQTATILLDPDLREELNDLTDELTKAKAHDEKSNDHRKATPKVEKQIEEFEERVSEARVKFKFRAIGREAYSLLLDEWKPRTDNTEDEDYGFNAAEFPPRLLALSAIQPELTLKDAQRIWAEWSDSETTLLIVAAVTANKELVDIPFTRAGTKMGTFSTESPSTTQPVEESPTPPS
jgi:hypothetical protein